MPLDRAHVTAAAQRTIPAYPIFTLVVGLNFLLAPRDTLLPSPPLRYVDDFATVRLWGVAFVAIAVALVAAMICRRRRVYQLALGAMILWLLLWAVTMVASAVFAGTSWSGWVWSAVIAWFGWATLVSLETGER